jgi:hypothetical protein
LRAYVRNHVDPLIGHIKVHRLDVENLDSFYRELRRCGDHYDRRPFLQHRTKKAHECDQRCVPHQCRGLTATAPPSQPVTAGPVRLELIHLGTVVRIVTVRADPTNFAVLKTSCAPQYAAPAKTPTTSTTTSWRCTWLANPSR